MISAVIVNFNGEAHLGRCLASLSDAAPLIDQVVVIDNASSDRSVTLVAERFPDVELVQLPENLGFGRAVNLAAARSRGDFLLLLNADTALGTGCLERLSRRVNSSPRLAMVAPQLYYPEGRPQFSWFPRTSVLAEAAQKVRNRFERFPGAHHGSLLALLQIVGPIAFCAACLLVRRSAYDAIGGFDPAIFLYFEDVDFCVRLRQQGWGLAFVPEAQAFHFSGGSRQLESEVQYRRSQLYYYRKHRPAWENALLRRLLLRKYRRLSRRRPAKQRILRVIEEHGQPS